jgi:hypothetical protein
MSCKRKAYVLTNAVDCHPKATGVFTPCQLLQIMAATPRGYHWTTAPFEVPMEQLIKQRRRDERDAKRS